MSFSYYNDFVSQAASIQDQRPFLGFMNLPILIATSRCPADTRGLFHMQIIKKMEKKTFDQRHCLILGLMKHQPTRLMGDTPQTLHCPDTAVQQLQVTD